MKKVTIAVILQLTVFASYILAQTKPTVSSQLYDFKAHLASINATFTFPEGAKEIKTPNNEKFPFEYGIKIPESNCEIWFQVKSTKAEWLRFEKDGKQGLNPDSLYLKTAAEQATKLAGEGNFIVRTAGNFLLSHYNADVGRSYFLTMIDMPETGNYQFGLMIVLQRNHIGNITALCMSNEKGPAFFRNLRKLQDCIRFEN